MRTLPFVGAACILSQCPKTISIQKNLVRNTDRVSTLFLVLWEELSARIHLTKKKIKECECQLRPQSTPAPILDGRMES